MNNLPKWITQLFTLNGTVNRWGYFLTGVLLMALKYLTEAGVVYVVTGRAFQFDDFLNPWVNAREQFLDGTPTWFGPGWALWTLPFVWVAIAMTSRRARDVGHSPWKAWLILVPVINFFAMILYCFYPTAPEPAERQVFEQKREIEKQERSHALRSAFLGGGVGFLYAFGVTLASIYIAGSYGSSLFFGVPIITSAATVYLYNRHVDQGWGASLGVALLPMGLVAAALLVCAFEGAICILMALPIMLPLGLLGGIFGKILARGETPHRTIDPHLWGCLIVLPICSGLENFAPMSPEFVVQTSVNISAPAETVWDSVIHFPPLTSPEPWYFRWGIASPQEATIEGSGVGAVRYCKFTTGEFVEPITVWHEPHRLAFDVTEQPEPMFELTPYRHVHPPHLEGAFRSTRGEFRLVALPNGQTRLEGRTWYVLEMGPISYWTIWTDAIIHRIHLRVLEHIKTVAESTRTL